MEDVRSLARGSKKCLRWQAAVRRVGPNVAYTSMARAGAGKKLTKDMNRVTDVRSRDRLDLRVPLRGEKSNTSDGCDLKCMRFVGTQRVKLEG